MSETIKLGSSATVIKPGIIKIVTIENPEDVLIKGFVTYLADTGYADAYPNFDNINVGAVHPFALLLFQEFNGESYSLDVFPSVTVSDSSMSESDDVLSDNRRDIIIDKDVVVWLESKKKSGEFFLSDGNLALLKTATDAGAEITGVLRELTRRHMINFSIWSANREITSLLFDMVQGFILDQKTALKQKVDMREISGSRTGDVNFDFGEMLFGATISLPVVSTFVSVSVDADIGIVEEVRIEPIDTVI